MNFEELFHLFPFGIAIKEISKQTYVYCNEKWLDIFMTTKEEIIGFDHKAFLKTEVNLKYLNQIDHKVLESNNMVHVSEAKFFTKVGVRYFDITKYPLVDENSQNKYIVEIFKDITDDVLERRLKEEKRVKLIHLSKMSSLSELTSSVSHEVNNPLTVIKGYARRISQVISKPEFDTDVIAMYADKIDITVTRIDNIINSMKNATRKKSIGKYGPVSIKQVVAEIKLLCREKFSYRNIDFEMENPDDDHVVYGSFSEISQVFTYLLENAYEAVEDLEERVIKVKLKYFVSPLENDTAFLDIEFQDNGKGILLESQDDIFNPFYTTKSSFRSGLGLSITKSIVTEHGGQVFICPKSKLNTLVVRLPVMKPMKAAS